MEDINHDIEQEEYSYGSDSDLESRSGDEEEDEDDEVDAEEDSKDKWEQVEDNSEDKKESEKETVDASSTHTDAIEGGDMKLANSGKKDENTGMMDLEIRVKELEAANTTKDKTIADMSKLFKDKERNLETLHKIVDEMRGRVECQVCLILPKQGPVRMCPNGHCICTVCKARNRQKGKLNCPTCLEGDKVPVGQDCDREREARRQDLQ